MLASRQKSPMQDPHKLLATYRQALQLLEQEGDLRGLATTLNNMGKDMDELGDAAKALAAFRSAIPLWDRLGDRAGKATTLGNQGSLYAGLGDLRELQRVPIS